MAKHLIPGDKTIQAVKKGDGQTRLSDGEGLYLLPLVSKVMDLELWREDALEVALGRRFPGLTL